MKTKIWHKVNKDFIRGKKGEELEFANEVQAHNFIFGTEIPFSKIDFLNFAHIQTPKQFAKETSPTKEGLRSQLKAMKIDKHIYSWMERYAKHYHEEKVIEALEKKRK